MSEDKSTKTLLHRALHWGNTTPDRVYMTQPYPNGDLESFTWQQTVELAKRLAAYIKSLELPPKSHIALVGKNSAHWIITDLAIWMAGCVTVPLYQTINEEAAAYVLENSEAKLIFIGKLSGDADTWPEIKRGIPADLPKVALPMAPLDDLPADTPKWDDIIANNAPLDEVADPELDDIATIVYTSGSTGKPKGVVHSFGTMVAAPKGLGEMFGITNEDRMLSYLPLAHVAERAAVETGSLYFGFHVYFANSLDTFQQDLQRSRPTIFFSVPRLWTKFYQGVNAKIPPKKQKLLLSIPILSGIVKKKILRELGLDSVRYAVTGSAPLSADLVRWYRNLGLEMLDAYGMTENFAYSHASLPGKVRIGYVGNSNPGVITRIAEDTGEIQIKSPAQMVEYYKLPEKTKEDVTDDGFFKTGDMGEIDDQGRLKITGRVKELFKTSKGKYVAPAPIEILLSDHPDVEVACVSGANRPQPYALLLLAEELQGKVDDTKRKQLTAEFEKLLTKVNSEIEKHERMKFMVVVSEQWTIENGFLTPTMKIKRNVIENNYQPKADDWADCGETIIWE